MKTTVHGIAVMALALFALPAAAQLSADDLDRLGKYRDRVAVTAPQPGELNVTSLAVGAKGAPTWIDAKVRQVIDGNRMLVGLEDSRTGDGDYSTLVMVKCPTKGITDGKFWRGGRWEEVTGSNVLAVTGTTTYETVAGATKRVFVVEPYKPSPEDVKKEQERQAQRREMARVAAQRRAEQAKAKKEAEAARKAADAKEGAERRLAYARKLLEDGKKQEDDKKIGRAVERLHELIGMYPDSKEAAEARKLLKDMEP
jgi:hypothetical protein